MPGKVCSDHHQPQSLPDKQQRWNGVRQDTIPPWRGPRELKSCRTVEINLISSFGSLLSRASNLDKDRTPPFLRPRSLKAEGSSDSPRDASLPRLDVCLSPTKQKKPQRFSEFLIFIHCNRRFLPCYLNFSTVKPNAKVHSFLLLKPHLPQILHTHP